MIVYINKTVLLIKVCLQSITQADMHCVPEHSLYLTNTTMVFEQWMIDKTAYIWQSFTQFWLNSDTQASN